MLLKSPCSRTDYCTFLQGPGTPCFVACGAPAPHKDSFWLAQARQTSSLVAHLDPTKLHFGQSRHAIFGPSLSPLEPSRTHSGGSWHKNDGLPHEIIAPGPCQVAISHCQLHQSSQILLFLSLPAQGSYQRHHGEVNSTRRHLWTHPAPSMVSPGLSEVLLAKVSVLDRVVSTYLALGTLYSAHIALISLPTSSKEVSARVHFFTHSEEDTLLYRETL